ncbi:GNAT family N-acetyltransferase [Pseudogemmobacter sonorensis]|uniref:GNAT family N-acetyltransferase n=1 Tax=Pseudogemmobacter sonorensis TaxID=2989681 RepID=UPI0036852831
MAAAGGWRIRPAGPQDCESIAAIYNHAVRHTTAIWNEVTVDAANRRDWLAARVAAGFPVLVAERPDALGACAADTGPAAAAPQASVGPIPDPRPPGSGPVVAGYAAFGPWRAFDGYRATVEHSVYVDPAFRGRGLARALMQALIAEARAQGRHVMVAAIEAGNAPSIALHRSLGFGHEALMPEVGQKFGRWLDLLFMELRLDDREAP